MHAFNATRQYFGLLPAVSMGSIELMARHSYRDHGSGRESMYPVEHGIGDPLHGYPEPINVGHDIS